jgi:hypothetical protein
MPTETDTVHDRIELAVSALSPAQMAFGLAFIAILGTTLFFAQEPLVHDAMHNFRHAAGVTCH